MEEEKLLEGERREEIWGGCDLKPGRPESRVSLFLREARSSGTPL